MYIYIEREKHSVKAKTVRKANVSDVKKKQTTSTYKKRKRQLRKTVKKGRGGEKGREGKTIVLSITT